MPKDFLAVCICWNCSRIHDLSCPPPTPAPKGSRCVLCNDETYRMFYYPGDLSFADLAVIAATGALKKHARD